MGYHDVISTNHDVISTILAFVIPLIWFGLFLLLFRLTCKLKWLTAVCLAVMATTVSSLLSLWLFTGLSAKRWVLFLPLIVCAVILVVQFLWRWISGDSATINAAERAKILRMVENGKISAEEGSELLDAMGRSSALRGQEKFSRLDMAMLVGAALVILGFFLPWVYIRMPKMLNSSIPQAPMSKSFSHQMPRPFVPGFLSNASVYQTGPNVGALGWVIFIIAVVSAVPVFVTPKDFLYKISMLQIFLILIGLVLVISVLVRAGHNLGAGLIICVAGFVIELCASAAKFKRLAA